jgi:hypothetical protein
VCELVPSAEIANDPDDVREWPINRVEIGDIPIEAARPGGLGFAPNGREPRLLMSRQSRRAVVTAYLLEAGRRDVIAPSIEIEEAGVAIVAQALLVVSSRI